MPLQYSQASRALQDQFDTRRLADRLVEVKVHHEFTPDDRQLIEGLNMFFLATVDDAGQPTCSYKGGDPGFVKVTGTRNLAFPNYDGNGMYLSMGNVEATHAVGLLFIDFEAQRRLRVDGVASIHSEDPLLAAFPKAQFVVRVEALRIYPNCPRYIHKYQFSERSSFVPQAATEPPIPGWKQADWARDVLPANDPARRDPGSGCISIT